MTVKTALSALAVAGLIAGGAVAGTNVSPKVDAGGGKGLVVVDLSQLDAEVLNDIANDLNVEVTDLADINSVALPITAAATVCNLEVAEIASGNERGSKSCAAESNSTALTQAVQKSMNAQ